MYQIREEGGEIEVIESQLKEFKNLVFAENMKNEDLAYGIRGLQEFIRSTKQQRALINQTLLILSDVYDSNANMSDNLRVEFISMLDHLEKQIKLNVH